MATFYILCSSALDRYYMGHTTEPMAERLRKHLSNHKSCRARAKDREVKCLEEWPDKSSAYRRELEVKSWKKRARIEALISM